ncbi:MAG: ABC transporter permease subunit [Candidatus Aminicenantes bacterium]|nr:ABC transporter permease subunit [Candidatus Aminicenantes bacterium]
MKVFRVFFGLELRRFLCKRNIIIFLLFLTLSFYFLQEGIARQQLVEKNKQTFIEIEKMKVKQYILYTQYGAYGVRLMFLPSTLSIFFNNSGHFSNLISNIDSGERLNIYNPFKGKTLFTEKSGALMDFSGLILLLGSLFALYFGYEALHHRKYLEFLSGFSHNRCREVFFPTIGSRVAILLLLLLITAGSSWGVLKLNCVALPGTDYRHLLIYLGVLFFTLLFFFSLGTVVSRLKTKSVAIITMIGLFFLFIFIIPWTIDKIISGKAAGMTDSYYLELEKLKIIMDFEKRAYDEIGIFRSGKKAPPAVIDLVESYWRKDFKKIEGLEVKLENEMKENIRSYQVLSMFFPSTFYLSVGTEISSRGYDNFLAFYRYVRDLKDRFVRFYFDKKFYTDQTDIESFVKGEENLFQARSRLPVTFGGGMLLTILYTIVLFTTSWLLLFKKMKKTIELPPPSFEPEKGKTYFILCENTPTMDRLFCFYESGRDAVGIDRISTEEIDLGIPVVDMVTHFCRIRGVDEKKAWGNLAVLGIRQADIAKVKRRASSPEMLKKIYTAVSLADEVDLVVVKDFVKDESRKFEEQFRRLLFILQKRGKIILYLGSEMFETRLKTLFQEEESNNAIVIDLMSVSLR